MAATETISLILMANSHNDTQFIWDVSKIEEENGVIKIQMGEFQWIDPMENEELDVPNER